MKSNWLIVLFIMLFVVPAMASDFSLSAKGGVYLPTDKELQSGYSAQVDLSWRVFYVYGQYIETQRRIAGQLAGTTDVLGFGLGMKVPLNSYIKVWGQIGYYLPTTDLTDGNKYAESHGFYWNKWGLEHGYNVHAYSIYEYKIQGSLGGALGVDMSYPISKHITANFSTGYYTLKFHETFYARVPNWKPTSGRIQTISDKDYSGITFSIGTTIKF